MYNRGREGLVKKKNKNNDDSYTRLVDLSTLQNLFRRYHHGVFQLQMPLIVSETIALIGSNLLSQVVWKTDKTASSFCRKQHIRSPLI